MGWRKVTGFGFCVRDRSDILFCSSTDSISNDLNKKDLADSPPDFSSGTPKLFQEINSLNYIK